MASQLELGLHRASMEALVRLSPSDPRRIKIEEMAHLAVKATPDSLPQALKPSGAELDLQAEWMDQSQRYIDLGFAEELGLTTQEYLASLPKFEPQPQEYKDRVDMPMLVEKRIPWERQAELAGIDILDYLQEIISQTTVWEDNHSQAPDVAYAGWFNEWGQVFPYKISPNDARKELPADLTGADPFEGVARQIHHPEDTANGKYFDLIGSQVGADGVVFLSHWDGKPKLDADYIDHAYPHWRPLVRGSKVVTRQLTA